MRSISSKLMPLRCIAARATASHVSPCRLIDCNSSSVHWIFFIVLSLLFLYKCCLDSAFVGYIYPLICVCVLHKIIVVNVPALTVIKFVLALVEYVGYFLCVVACKE